VIRVEGLRKRYPRAPDEVLRGVDLEVEDGAFVSLVGRSGCGKSTLLHIIAALDRSFEGTVEVGGRDLATMSDREAAGYRRQTVGVVFQAYHLLDHLNCVENVALAARFGPRRSTAAERRATAEEALDRVGLRSAADRRPAELSGGERQRVSLARALFHRPRLLLLDEPTGNLDAATGNEILDLLTRLHADSGLTLLAATHDLSIESACSRLLRLENGALNGGPAVFQ
jgi:ABC-type lipoprotein export system ATPase subunit